jgi:hypothetical protein
MPNPAFLQRIKEALDTGLPFEQWRKSYRAETPMQRRAAVRHRHYLKIKPAPKPKQFRHESQTVRTGRWRKRNPKAYAAHQKIHWAVKVGKLKRASRCAHCGKKSPTEGHHPDYSKPLEVIWLCRACHGKQPRKSWTWYQY